MTETTPKLEMVDIHMHLIPGVDDGAWDDTVALHMVYQATQQGIYTIFATPHSLAFDRHPFAVTTRLEMLKDKLVHYCPDVKLHLGCEVLADPYRMDEILDALESGKYPAMNGKYVLTEFSPWGTAEEAETACEMLINARWKPIIAHLERYPYFQNRMDLVDRLRDMGCLVQVNSCSLFEVSDDAIQNWACRLIAEKKVDFLGTDAHNTTQRPPYAQRGLQWIYEHCEKEYADNIAWRNAEQLLCKAETRQPLEEQVNESIPQQEEAICPAQEDHRLDLPCSMIRDFLLAYLDDDCCEETEAALKEHFSHCTECRELFEQSKLEHDQWVYDMDQTEKWGVLWMLRKWLRKFFHKNN